MAIEICPLAADIGNLADWAAVGVTAIGAVAVFMLSRAENRTANASLELSKGVQDRENALLLREKGLLLGELTRDVMSALSSIEAIKSHTEAGLENWDTDARFINAVQGLSLTVADRERDRLHLLPDYAASIVVEAQQAITELRAIAIEFNDHVLGTEMAAHFFPSVTRAASHVETGLNRAFQSLTVASAMNR